MEFKSQICTTKEQSERLLKLGLKKETADMVWVNDSYNTSLKESLWRPVVLVDCEAIYIENHRIPAWSLHRLLEMLYADIGECMIFFPNTYEEIISDIETLIRRWTFNKDYLEEKRKRNHDCKRDYTLHEVWSIDEHS